MWEMSGSPSNVTVGGRGGKGEGGGVAQLYMRIACNTMGTRGTSVS